MKEELHERLLEDIERLRGLLAECSTESILGQASVTLYEGFSGPSSTSLTSPVKQMFFMLGLMLSSPEPTRAKDLGADGLDESTTLLNRIFLSYSEMYWPEGEDLSNMPKEWRQRREVAMAAFLHYFNVLMVASVEQLKDRIRRYLIPLDDSIAELLGLNASTVLHVTDWIVDALQKRADKLGEIPDLFKKEHKVRTELLQKMEDEGWDFDRLREESLSGEWGLVSQQIMAILGNHLKIDPEDLRDEFGKATADRYMALFVSRRGEIDELTYPTEQNLAERKPLFELPAGHLFCPFGNMLYIAANEVLEGFLRTSPLNEAFLHHRDRALEAHVSEQFARLFSTGSLYLENAYETPDKMYEHDLIILWDSTLLVVEAKATPPIEPMRDPEKAFIRIRDAFRGDTGIQKAYQQALRMRRALEKGKRIRLFDEHGRVVGTIDPNVVEETHLICITRDDFGLLAVDLSMLLEKEDQDPYPWATNVLDLSYMIDSWEYLGWGPAELLRYLRERRELHGVVISSDELEVAGFFIEHGELGSLIRQGSRRVLLSETYSDILDRIYAATKGGGRVQFSPTHPTFEQLAEDFARAFPCGTD